MNSEDRFSRQSFLGEVSQSIIEASIIAIVGLGGGGSHIVQQLSHIGFKNFIIYDDDTVELSNFNRLIGATEGDIGILQTEISKRIISGLSSDANIEIYNTKWQENPEGLRRADIVFGCLDGFSERRALETSTRRYLIPYIDIGMDVFPSIENQPPRMAGQVILSLPGELCMKCLGFLNDKVLEREAAAYTAAGINPQVVWPNGLLASTAVGIAMDILCGWTKENPKTIYLSYDGNKNTLTEHPRLKYLHDKECTHYPLSQLGDPVYTEL